MRPMGQYAQLYDIPVSAQARSHKLPEERNVTVLISTDISAYATSDVGVVSLSVRQRVPQLGLAHRGAGHCAHKSRRRALRMCALALKQFPRSTGKRIIASRHKLYSTHPS